MPLLLPVGIAPSPSLGRQQRSAQAQGTGVKGEGLVNEKNAPATTVKCKPHYSQQRSSCLQWYQFTPFCYYDKMTKQI